MDSETQKHGVNREEEEGTILERSEPASSVESLPRLQNAQKIEKKVISRPLQDHPKKPKNERNGDSRRPLGLALTTEIDQSTLAPMLTPKTTFFTLSCRGPETFLAIQYYQNLALCDNGEVKRITESKSKPKNTKKSPKIEKLNFNNFQLFDSFHAS